MAKALTFTAALSNALTVRSVPTDLQAADRGRWWWNAISVREPFTGAWQRNMEERTETLLTYHAVYACITLIASDIAKCRLKLVEQDANGIWNEISASAFSPVLRKPNNYQNRIQFIESWVTSKLINGNTYVWKERDARGVVTSLYVLDPTRTKTLVAPDGSVFYQLYKDNLSGVEDDAIIVPASEIIHDMTTLRYHPLCGVPPMAPAALAARHGLNIQRNSTSLFANGARPGGILSAPAGISDDDAKRIKEYWDTNFIGANAGKVVVVGDGLAYTPLAQNAVDSQTIEQLGISGKMVCSSFNVPGYMVGVGDPPAYNNIEALNQQYYSQCLQKLIEDIELLLDEGLGLTEIIGKTYGTEFDLDDLLRMDTATMTKSLQDGVRGGFLAPNEARKKLNYKPVAGGDTPYMQHQDYGLAALSKRDASDDPFAKAPGASVPAPSSDTKPPANDNATEEEIAAAKLIAGWKLKSLLPAA